MSAELITIISMADSIALPNLNRSENYDTLCEKLLDNLLKTKGLENPD